MSFQRLGKALTVLVSAGIAIGLESYIVTPIEYITFEAFSIGVVTALKAAITTMAAVIILLIYEVLVALVGRRAKS